MSSVPNGSQVDGDASTSCTKLLSRILHEVGAHDRLQALVSDDHRDESILLLSKLEPRRLSEKYGFPLDAAAAFVQKCTDHCGLLSVLSRFPISSSISENSDLAFRSSDSQSCGAFSPIPFTPIALANHQSPPHPTLLQGDAGGASGGGKICNALAGSSEPHAMFLPANTGILISPIAKTAKPNRGVSESDSFRDYNEQLALVTEGEVMRWDDNDFNQTRKGDLLGFRKHNHCVEIHRVVDICPPHERLPSWNDPKHSNRQVLVLSNRLCVIPWCDWVQFAWHATGSLVGTQRVANNQARVEMIHYVNKLLHERVYRQNQIDAAEKIIAAFRECHWATLLAFPQSGKTHVFYLVACKMLTSHRELQRAVVVCGNSELELAAQLRASKTELIRSFVKTDFGYSDSMIADLDSRIDVLCGADLKCEIMSPSVKASNTLFIWEEAHYAQDRKNLPHKFFENLGITADGEPSNLEGERNNYVLTVSATPFSELCNMARHSQKKRIVRLEPAQAYKGPKHFRNNILQFDPELAHEDILAQAISDHFFRTSVDESPKYAIVRVIDSKGKKNVTSCIERATALSWAHRLYDSETKLKFANSMQSMDELAVAPECNTVIFIRGMCRMGKRVPKEHISFVIETAKESKTDTLLQGLMGRMFGYHDCMNIRIWISKLNELDEISRYERMMESPLQDSAVVTIMPQKGKNLIGCLQEWYPNVPVHVKVAPNDDEDADPDAEEHVKHTAVKAIQRHFQSSFVGDGNSIEQNVEIREQIALLTEDSIDLRNFMKSSNHLRRPLQEQDAPIKLREAIDHATPLKSFRGYSFQPNVQIIVWRCNTEQFSQSLGFNRGDLILQTRTRAASLQQGLLPETTGDETFKTADETGAFHHDQASTGGGSNAGGSGN